MPDKTVYRAETAKVVPARLDEFETSSDGLNPSFSVAN